LPAQSKTRAWTSGTARFQATKLLKLNPSDYGWQYTAKAVHFTHMQNFAKVANAPAKPLMIYDGECHFCKFWIRRWQHLTAGRVDYLESQNERVPAQFPELSREQFERSVQFIETDGQVYDGAGAVFRALAYASSQQWPLWLYQNVPGTASAAEACYQFVAEHRTAFGGLTRLLWGKAEAVPEHKLVSSVFLRLLGIIYLCAFVSLGTQISGLLGGNGILPAHQFMTSARMQLDQGGIGVARYWMLPTLCWFGSGDACL
jgi:predicted DCC family thiol-disulfide oxidoreductase YuxK